MFAQLLPPPAQVPLAHGDARGGIFDAPWLPADFIGPGYAPMPIDASTPQPVPPSVTGHEVAWASTAPRNVPLGAMWEMVGLPPQAIPQFRPIQRRYRGGIFKGAGGVHEMAFARPQWTRWQLANRARAGAGCCW